MKLYKYEVYGLNIISEVEMNQLITKNFEDREADVFISLKKIDYSYHQKKPKDKWFLLEQDSFYFEATGVAKYLIKDGKNIFVETEENYDFEKLKIFIIGTCLGIIMIQNNNLAIHGSSVLIDDSVYIFTGKSGAGKSSLTNKFIRNGYKFLSDDVSAIGIENKEFYVNPSYCQQRLCSDTIKKFNYDLNDYRLRDEKRDKYEFSIKESFLDKKKKIKYIFEIIPSDVEDVRITELNGLEKLNLIMRNIYRVETMEIKEVSKKYLKLVAMLAKDIKVFVINRNFRTFSVDKQLEEVLKIQ